MFLELERELESELEARRIQFAFYRDHLISTCGGLSREMGTVGTFTRGRRFTKSDYVDSGIPAVHYGDIYTTYGTKTQRAVRHVPEDLRPRLRFAEPGDVIIASVGETVEDVAKATAWLGAGPVAAHDDTFIYRSELNPTYVAYAMQTRAYAEQKGRHVSRAKVKRMSGEGLGRIEIPVPSRAQQDEIVASLDAFDALMNDQSGGLPAELHARRRQYEHYRDRLLSFEERSA